MGVTTSGAITQSGVLAVTGAHHPGSGGGQRHHPDNATNTFSTVAVTTGRNVALTDADAIDLGASTVSGTLSVTAGGAITDSGNLSVTGASSFTVPNATSITLDSAGNSFGGTVSFLASAGTIQDVTVVDTTPLDLQALTLLGNLSVTATGITQSGAFVVPGTTTLSAGAANDITLNNAANNFGTVAVSSAATTSAWRTPTPSILGASTISGTLGVSTSGAITQSGVLAVTGVTTLAAGAANDITLSNAANTFSTVAVSSGNNVSLADANAIILGASTISGTLGVTTSGAITQSGVLAVTGVTTLAAGAANDITLTNAANTFSTVAVS